MAGRLYEVTGSGDFSVGPSGVEGEGHAFCIQCADQDEAYALADAFFPADVSGIPRGSIKVKDHGGGVFEVHVDYSTSVFSEADPTTGETPTPIDPTSDPSQAATGGGNPPAGQDGTTPVSRDISFSFGGKTVKTFVSEETIDSGDGTGNSAANKYGLLGVSREGVEGKDLPCEGGDFSISKKLTTFTEGYFSRIASWVGKSVNNAPFKGFEAGEVRLDKVDGKYTDADGWNLVFTFEYIPWSKTKLTIRGVETTIEKAGHDLLEVIYAPYDDTVANIKLTIFRPTAYYVERVFRWRDFSLLGL